MHSRLQRWMVPKAIAEFSEKLDHTSPAKSTAEIYLPNLMNDQPLFSTIEPDVQCKLASRRDTLNSLLKLGGVALTAPIVLATLSQQAYGSSMSPGVISVLRFALLLERLEHEFYEKGLKAPGRIPSQHRAVFERIKKSEGEHVALLGAATGRLINNDEFNFTAGGRFPDVFSDYKTFLALSQCFEDTGVRAYKGQTTNLMPVGLLLTIALKIHSVEARHASEVRRIRVEKGWITASSRGSLPPFCQPIYNGDGLTTQAGVNLAGIGGTPAVPRAKHLMNP